MKVWPLLLLYFLTLSYAYGQDIITRTDGKRIEAAIQEISSTQIRYRLFAQPEGPLYIIGIADVQAVEEADGVRRTFSQETGTPAASTAVDYESGWGRNLLLFSPLRLFNNNLAFAYEYIFPSGKVGVRVPVTVGLQKEEDDYSYGLYSGNVPFGTGVALHYYPHGQGRLRYYLGPMAQIGFFRFRTYSPSGNYGFRRGSLMELKLVNGSYYQIDRTLFVAIDFGLGFRRVFTGKDDVGFYPYGGPRFILPLNVHIGLRL